MKYKQLFTFISYKIYHHYKSTQKIRHYQPGLILSRQWKSLQCEGFQEGTAFRFPNAVSASAV